jgi:hypothetical protein
MDAWLSQARDAVAGAAGTPASDLEIDDGSAATSSTWPESQPTRAANGRTRRSSAT